MENEEVYARSAVEGLAFRAWLCSGTVPADILALAPKPDPDVIETKGNPYHDPVNGQFTFGPGGANGTRGYRGMTAHGPGIIRPVSGGGTDRNGRPVPEMFPPDPYALRTPAEALAHYVDGSGEERNYYFNKVDKSEVKLSDFPAIAKLTSNGSTGVYPIVDAAASYNGGLLGKADNLSSAATVGGLTLKANGMLAIAKDGSYSFSGRLSADQDKFDFNPRSGRSAIAEASTTIGRQLTGREFLVNMIGSKPFSARGRRKVSR